MPTFVNDGGSGVPSFVTKWGQHGEGDGEFILPLGVAVDSSGYVYVGDFGMDRMQKFDSEGTFIIKWGRRGPEDGEFRDPTGVAVDSSGYVYVAEVENDRIQKFDFEGTFITKWGRQGTGNRKFNGPVGVAVDSSNNVYVTDQGNTPASRSSGEPLLRKALRENGRPGSVSCRGGGW